MKKRFLLLYFFCLFQRACLFEEEDIPMDRKLRCKEDGFCITNQSGKWFQGGYRKGELEIEFDVVHIPDFVVTMNGGNPYAARLVFGLRHEFVTSAASGYPRSWNHELNDSDYLEAHEQEKNKLFKEMEEYLPNHPIPKGFESHWQKLLNIVKMEAEPYTFPSRINEPNLEVRDLPTN